MVRDGSVRLAAGRPPLSIAASVGWRPASLGGELGALRVTSWLRLGIPGNVLCMPMRWIRKNDAQLSPARLCLLQRCFRPFPSFLHLGAIESSSIHHQLLPSNYLTGSLTTTLVTISQQSHQTTT